MDMKNSDLAIALCKYKAGGSTVKWYTVLVKR